MLLQDSGKPLTSTALTSKRWRRLPNRFLRLGQHGEQSGGDMVCSGSPWFTPLWLPPSSAHPSRTTTAMWPHINHTGFWLINFDNPNLHRESYDLRLWIVLSARVQTGPPPLRGKCERVSTNHGLYSHPPSITRRARSAIDQHRKTQSVPQHVTGWVRGASPLTDQRGSLGDPLVHEGLALLQRAVRYVSDARRRA